MALHTVALCEGKYIRIEMIYTVFDGKQIDKPRELAELRENGRAGKLLSPCGCAASIAAFTAKSVPNKDVNK